MEFLDHNKAFLEHYVTEKIPVEVIERWLSNKVKNNYVSMKLNRIKTNYQLFLIKQCI